MMRAPSLVALTLAATCASVLCGCGGGTVASHPSLLPAKKAGGATAQFSIVVPGTSNGAGQTAQSVGAKILVRPNYVSENAQSLVVTIGGVNGVSTTFNLTATSEGCSQPGGAGTAVTCTESIAAPVGTSEAWAFDLYSEPNGAGSLLAMTNDPVTIRSGVVNNLGVFTLNGVVGSYSLSWVGGTPGFTADTSSTATLVLTVLDPSGATIIAPGEYVDAYGNPVTFALSDNIADSGSPYSNTSWTYALSPTSFGPAASSTATSNAVTVSYGGIAMFASTIGVSDSENVQSGGATLTVPPVASVISWASGGEQCFGGAAFVNGLVELLGVESGCTVPFVEPGWTDSPYQQLLTEASSCGSDVEILSAGVNTWLIEEVPGIGGPSCSMVVSGGNGVAQVIEMDVP